MLTSPRMQLVWTLTHWLLQLIIGKQAENWVPRTIPVPIHVCISLLSIVMIEELLPKAGMGLFGLPNPITVHHEGNSEQELNKGTQGQGQKQRAWRHAAYWLVSMACLACFFIQPRPTCPVVASYTVGWNPQHLTLIKKILHGSIWWSHFFRQTPKYKKQKLMSTTHVRGIKSLYSKGLILTNSLPIIHAGT